MTTLFRNGTVINVFTGEMEKANVLIENGTIIGVGDYDEGDETIDLTGKFLAPGLIDSHIHIESTMLLPYEFARAVLPHGTTAVIADPHEIGNVAGAAGLQFMLEGSRGLPLDFYWMMPSCVPSTRFDESGAVLSAHMSTNSFAAAILSASLASSLVHICISVSMHASIVAFIAALRVFAK